MSVTRAMAKRHDYYLAIAVMLTLFAGMATSGLSQTSKPRSPRLVVKHRKATVLELYSMFFSYAVHVDATSNSDELKGANRSFYRHHMQMESGMSDDEYASILSSAKRYSQVASETSIQLEEQMALLKKTRAASQSPIGVSSSAKAKAKAAYKQKRTSRDQEITAIRFTLGKERSEAFEQYLQTIFVSGGLADGHLSDTPNAQSSADLNANPNNVIINPVGDVCQDYEGYDPDDGDDIDFTLCVVGQAAWYSANPASGHDTVEFTASIEDSDFGDIFVYEVDFESDLTLDGNLVAGGNDVDAYVYPPVLAPLTAGNPNTYVWGPTAAVAYFDSDGDDEGWCEPFDGPPVEVALYLPDISPDEYTVIQGQPNSKTVDGYNTISPFLNSPTVSLSDTSICAPFSFSALSPTETGSQIAISCTVPSDAYPDTYTMTVSNGFGADSADLIVQAPPPVINSVIASSPGVLVAGSPTPQTITITGKNFGTVAPNITIYQAPTGVTKVSAPFYTPGNSGVDTVTFQVTTADTTPLGQVFFELQATNGSQASQSVSTYPNFPITVQPVTLVPQIMRVSSVADMANCTNGTPTASGANQLDVYAGEQVLLCVLPPPAGFKIINQSWEFDNIDDITGGFVNATGVVGTQPSAVLGATEAADPSLINNSLWFYFVNPNTTETATYSWTLNNGPQPEAMADFNIVGPSGNLSPQATMLQTATNGISDGVSTIYNSTNDDYYLSTTGVADPSNPSAGAIYGIVFTSVAAIPQGTNQSGVQANQTFTWIQLLNNVGINALVPVPGPASPTDTLSAGLDAAYPYGNATSLSTRDTPSIELKNDFGELARQFDATMYLMWDPGVGPPNCHVASFNIVNNTYVQTPSTCYSTPIPLGSIRWTWSGCAINTDPNDLTNNQWLLHCGKNQLYPGTSPTSYPSWGVGQTVDPF